MKQVWLAHNVDRSGPNKDIPVVVEVEVSKVADWPDFHLATDNEIDDYERYWNDVDRD